ncbi:hypothetical protein Dda_5182 [Drechslerella dactyloides]|uniref:Uncharacterized protein n=1 Tax=Drechslerella dactyloides TaxID=74499 RepID=A0AAD6IXU3_DREDA|nr:hypothetical protein Dda_5182 [Drechslerella dactyloides]
MRTSDGSSFRASETTAGLGEEEVAEAGARGRREAGSREGAERRLKEEGGARWRCDKKEDDEMRLEGGEGER